MKKNKKYIIITLVLFVMALVYTLLIKYVDVDSIGPNGSEVGFATINGFFHNMIGEKEIFYKISKYFLLIFHSLLSGASSWVPT